MTLVRLLHRTRYAASLGRWWLLQAAGGPQYLDELKFWEQTIRTCPAGVFDPQVRDAAFPAELADVLKQVAATGRQPRVLEVGSGPLSLLAAGVDRALFDLVAVDPLAVAYRNLLRMYGIRYPIDPIAGRGETLAAQFPLTRFDAVYCSNALDHTRSPIRSIAQMCDVLRPGGFLVLEGFVREGSEGGWAGLHQHDLFPERG